MKLLSVLLMLIVVFPLAHAQDCKSGVTTSDKDCAESPVSFVLPDDAKAEVKDLHTHMRFFTAIGFHDKAAENRAAIVAIYEKHGVAVPMEYTKN